MNRRTVNFIRFIFEELLPPILRDSILFKYLVKYTYRSDHTHETLKENILNISKKDYIKYYEDIPEIQGETDNSKECIEEIIKEIVPKDLIDVGCGRGYLLKKIMLSHPNLNLHGSEIFKSEKLKLYEKNFKFTIFEKEIEDLVSINKSFDTVICTHVLEHVLDIQSAYLNLKKICKKKLIIVVPKERPYKYTFNGHIHFFPYDWSFINSIRPENKNYKIKTIYRDFVYVENID